jgi:hypothetical protein
MNRFRFIGNKGAVDFNNPDGSFWIIEDVGEKPGDDIPKQIYYCREVFSLSFLIAGYFSHF